MKNFELKFTKNKKINNTDQQLNTTHSINLFNNFAYDIGIWKFSELNFEITRRTSCFRSNETQFLFAE